MEAKTISVTVDAKKVDMSSTIEVNDDMSVKFFNWSDYQIYSIRIILN